MRKAHDDETDFGHVYGRQHIQLGGTFGGNEGNEKRILHVYRLLLHLITGS